MTRAAWAVAAAAGVTLAAGAGCYSPPQYGPPYGYPAPPAYPAAPGGYVVPGTTAPGTLGSPTTVPGSGPTLAPPINGGDAPPYGTFDSNSPTPAGPSVPDEGYRDPTVEDFNSGSGGASGAGGPVPDDGFQPPASNDGEFGDSPFMRQEGTAAPRRLGVEHAATPPVDNRDYFAGLDRYQRADRPAASEPALADSGIRPAAFEEGPSASEDFGFDPVTTPEAATAEAGYEGFGYEPSGYHWLRGVIDYDPAQRNWHVIYGLQPDPSDRFGGSLTLADNGHLSEFQDNDVVLLQGRVDPAAGRDLLNKPLYRVMNAELIGRFE